MGRLFHLIKQKFITSIKRKHKDLAGKSKQIHLNFKISSIFFRASRNATWVYKPVINGQQMDYFWLAGNFASLYELRSYWMIREHDAALNSSYTDDFKRNPNQAKVLAELGYSSLFFSLLSRVLGGQCSRTTRKYLKRYDGVFSFVYTRSSVVIYNKPNVFKFGNKHSLQVAHCRPN